MDADPGKNLNADADADADPDADSCSCGSKRDERYDSTGLLTDK